MRKFGAEGTDRCARMYADSGIDDSPQRRQRYRQRQWVDPEGRRERREVVVDTVDGSRGDSSNSVTAGADDTIYASGRTIRSSEDQTDGWAMQAADPIAGAPDQ